MKKRNKTINARQQNWLDRRCAPAHYCGRYAIMKKIILLSLLILSSISMADTLIKEESFHVKLPDNWSLIDSSGKEGLWIYQSSNGDERLTVSIKYFTKSPSFGEIEESIESYVSIRKKLSSEMHTGISISPDEYKKYPAAITNTFLEKGPKDRKAANKTIASKVGIANFYYESYENGKAFMEKLNSILSSTGFAS